MDTIGFLKKNHNGIIQIISTLRHDFSSHDFLEKFAEQYESEYIDMLVNYQNTGRAFQTVHSMIAKYLSQNMTTFHIDKTSRDGSENVFGTIDFIQWWKKI